MMLIKDGDYTIYMIEVADLQGSGQWSQPNWSNFGIPSSLTDFDDGWAILNVPGTLSKDIGLAELAELSADNPMYRWRLMEVRVSQHQREVARMSATDFVD